MKRLGLIIVLICTLAACQKRSLTPMEYVSWVNKEDNGCLVKKEIGQFEFALQYKPIEYVVLMEEKDEHLKKQVLEKRMTELKGMQYYTLKITSKEGKEFLKTGISSEEEYYGRLQYFVSAMQDDLALIEGKDTLPCLLYHFERNYGLAPYNNIVLGFKTGNEGKAEDKTLIYEDQVLGLGPVRLTINGKDISNTPNLISY